MQKPLTFLAPLAFLAAFSLPAAAQDATPADPSTVVATVGDTEITVGHMIVAWASLPEQYQGLPDDVLFQGILDQLVQQTALQQQFSGDLPSRISLQLENEKLKRELADANRSSKALTLPVKTTGPAADKPAPNADGTPGRFRQYTITKGDSLSSIARKIYGDAGPARISAIFNANRDKMTSVNNLPKIGTVILLPE